MYSILKYTHHFLLSTSYNDVPLFTLYMGNAAPHHLAQEINRCDWIPGWSNPTAIKPGAVALLLQRLDFRRPDTRGYGKRRKVLCLYASCGLVSSSTWRVEFFIQRRECQQSEAAVPCPMTNWQLGNEDRGTFPKVQQ